MTAPERHQGPAEPLSASYQAQSQSSLAILALFIGLLTLFIDQAAAIFVLSTTRTELTKTRAAQEPQLEQARRIEQQLDALASGTARLAAEGNANAAAIVATLQAQGVTINEPRPASK